MKRFANLGGPAAGKLQAALYYSRLRNREARIAQGGSIERTVQYDFVTKSTLAAAAVLGPSLTFARNSIASKYDALGVLSQVSANAAAFDFDPVSHVQLGLLIEDFRSNMYLRSAEFDNASWTKSAASITANGQAAPDGTTTGDLIYPNAANSASRYAYQTLSLLSANTYSISCFFHAGTYTGNVQIQITGTSLNALQTYNLGTGQYVSGSGSGNSIRTQGVRAIGGGWYRFRATFKTNADQATAQVRVGYAGTQDNTSGSNLGFYMWGAQCEIGEFGSSYIPTTTAGASRQAAVLTSDIGAEFDPAAHTGAVRFMPYGLVTGGSCRALQWDDGSANNRITIRQSSTRLVAEVVKGGVSAGTIQGPTLAVNTSYEAGVTFNGSKLRFAVNGQSYGELETSPPSGLTKRRIGCDAAGANQFSGWFQSLVEYKGFASYGTLEAITS